MVFDKFRQRKALQKDLKSREEELRQIQLNLAYGPLGQPPSYDQVTKDKHNESSFTRMQSTAAYSTRSDASSSASSVSSVP